MLKQTTKRLRDRTVVTAAILSLMAPNAYAADPLGGAHANDKKTKSPIKHVIVIIGENRTFDHVFATYEPRQGEHVDNLLSKGIIKEDGSPGPNYAKAAQFSTTVNNFYSINPTPKTPYNTTTNKLQAPATSYAPQNCYATVELASLNGPGCLSTLSEAKRGDYGLNKGHLPLLTIGATGVPGGSPDTRILDYANLPNGPYPLVTLASGEDETSSLYKTYGGSPVHRFYQMLQELAFALAQATNRKPSGCQAHLVPFFDITGSPRTTPNPTPKPLKESDI